MKSFYHSYYRFYKPEQKEQKILAISDVHFCRDVAKNLERMAAKIEQEQPNLITISGDLLDNLDTVASTADRAELKAWLERLGKVAPVCLCLGNHDFFYKPEGFKSAISKDHGYGERRDDELYAEINAIDNIHLLDNDVYEDERNFIVGLTLPSEYYRGQEDENVLHTALETIKPLLDQLPKKSKQTKILLVHSPVFLNRAAIKKQIADFDFVLTGHMHNGIVPPLLQEVWRGHNGIVTPSKQFFKDANTRLGLYNDQLIGLGAVTTVQKGAKPFGIFNGLYPIYYATITTSHNEADSRKPDVKHKYEK